VIENRSDSVNRKLLEPLSTQHSHRGVPGNQDLTSEAEVLKYVSPLHTITLLLPADENWFQACIPLILITVTFHAKRLNQEAFSLECPRSSHYFL
jgi:hypothetical protein